MIRCGICSGRLVRRDQVVRNSQTYHQVCWESKGVVAPRQFERARDVDTQQTITRQDAENLHALLLDESIPWRWVLERYGVSRAGELTVAQVKELWDMAGDERLGKEFKESQGG